MPVCTPDAAVIDRLKHIIKMSATDSSTVHSPSTLPIKAKFRHTVRAAQAIGAMVCNPKADVAARRCVPRTAGRLRPPPGLGPPWRPHSSDPSCPPIVVKP